MKELYDVFLAGQFGQSVSVGVQVLATEDGAGKKFIDDGLSTILALSDARADWEKDSDITPAGEVWDPQLVDIFKEGLTVKEVVYTDDEDKDMRFMWNVGKHDQDCDTVPCSSVFQKIETAKMEYSQVGK